MDSRDIFHPSESFTPFLTGISLLISIFYEFNTRYIFIILILFIILSLNQFYTT